MIKQNQANTHTRTFAGCWRNRTHGFHDALVPRNGCFKHVEGHGKLSRCVGSPHSFSPHYQTFRHIILCCSHLSRHTRQIDITSTAMETENLSLCLKAGGTLIMGIHLFYDNASTSGVKLSPRSSGGKYSWGLKLHPIVRSLDAGNIYEYFNTILPSMSRSAKWCLPFGFPNWNWYTFLVLV